MMGNENELRAEAWAIYTDHNMPFAAKQLALKVVKLIDRTSSTIDTDVPAENTAQQFESLTRCAAARDGECHHSQCPQLRDNEPHATGRHCPIDNWDDE